MKSLRLTIVIVSSLLLFTAFINMIVNPYGYYGNKQLTVTTLCLNFYKLKALKEAEVKPKAIIYGSSNALSMDTKLVENLTGLKTYNYGIFQFTVEDFYCSVHALYEDSIKPKLIILCMDDWLLADRPSPKDEVFKGAQNRLSYKPDLSKFLPDYSSVKLNWNRFKSSLSSTQLEASFPEFADCAVHFNFSPLSDKELMKFFNKDGTRNYFSVDNFDITASAEKGQYDVEGYLKKKHELLMKYPDKSKGLLTEGQEIFKEFSPHRIQLLERTLKFLEEKDCKVILNIMPVQPYYKKLIEENTNYGERMNQLLHMCSAYKNKYHNIIMVRDNHELDSFNGKANYFFDQIHLTASNSTLMLESLLKNLSGDAFQ
jgi:plasmid maintenance system killer protein